ncbi:MAG TPA: hypothetical protein VFK30_10870, partial [Anaerolineae bacterium]|nr:hypothetical protein [Anaerolineae bacterium]
KRSAFTVRSITLVLIAVGLLGACCPPNCPPEPTFLIEPPQWQTGISHGQFDEVIQGATSVIDQGRSAKYYAEAHLYRGLALLHLGKDFQAAQADFEVANRLVDQLNTLDQKQEQLTLLTSQMIVNVRLGNQVAAETFRLKAIDFAPDQADKINEQFKSLVPSNGLLK